MVAFVLFSYFVLFSFGIYMFKRIFVGKKHHDATALIYFCILIFVTCLFVVLVFLTPNIKHAFLYYSLYYISFSLAMAVFFWFSKDYCQRKTSNPFLSVISYFELFACIFIICNYFNHFLFTVERHPFGHRMYWYKCAKSPVLSMIYLIWIVATLGVMINMAIEAFHSPRLYRPRYVWIAIITFLHTVIQSIGLVNEWPIWLNNIFLLPFAAFIVYFSINYSDRVFKDSALLYVADNLNDCFILYGEDDHVIYINERLKNLLTIEQLIQFEVRNKFAEWVNDASDLNGIWVKKIATKYNEFFFTVIPHEFNDKKSYLGISYTLQDVTTTIERLKVVEQANEDLSRAAHMKSDFLANMSHEIRTPMNAVIGMAEMALREDMSDDAREYISQIKSSGHTLLNIINDILDFSKVESGKMEIIPVEYSPLSELNNIANTLMSRIGDKDIELTVEENPNMPSKLEGDVLRIRQIIINIANNAIKFTDRGRVQISADFIKTAEDEVRMIVHVIDTGIGIKDKDIGKLFSSFQQVDTKRNRTIEGTGLGLAISKNLVVTMGGSINVESEYGEGSDFYFEIPQKVLDWTPSITIEEPEKLFAFGMFNKKYLSKRFFKDSQKLGVFAAVLKSPADFSDVCELYDDYLAVRRPYLFFEEYDYDDDMKTLLSENPRFIGILFADYGSVIKSDLPNLRVYKKPMTTLSIAMAYNNLVVHSNTETSKAYENDFIAPNARVLIVDDNSINITIAEGLMEPLQMQIDSALSGHEAIDMLKKEKYDIVFMDHMMPQMDGVETTKIIRQSMPELADMPIIALTANAISGVKEYFLSVGMNDFVPKPIEVRDIINKVRTWLSPDKISRVTEAIKTDDSASDLNIPGIETEGAIKMLGSKAIYLKVLTQYYETIEKNYSDIKDMFDAENWENYTIKVHALKSSSRQIGALNLGELAYTLEMAGHDGDIALIREKTDQMLQEYLSLRDILCPICEKTDEPGEKIEVSKNEIEEHLLELKDACDSLDMDKMEELADIISKFELSPEQSKIYLDIKQAIDMMDVDTCIELVDTLISSL